MRHKPENAELCRGSLSVHYRFIVTIIQRYTVTCGLISPSLGCPSPEGEDIIFICEDMVYFIQDKGPLSRSILGCEFYGSTPLYLDYFPADTVDSGAWRIFVCAE